MTQKLLNAGVVLLAVGLLQACDGADSSSLSTGQAGTSGNGSSLYEGLRMSRAFLEKNLSGTIKIQGADDSKPLELNSSVSMDLRPQDGPAPSPGYIADFRDQKDCATYTSIHGASLCFTVSPDVSSFDVNGKKVVLEGFEPIVEDHLNAQVSSGCDVTVKNTRYSAVVQTPDGFKVTFLADQVTGPQCAQGSAQKTALIEVSLQD